MPLARRREGQAILGVTGVIGALLIWEFASRTGIVPTYAIPPLSEVLPELARQLGEPAFWQAIGQTMLGWSLGLGLSILIGVPLGMLMGSSVSVQRALRPTVEFLRPVPGVALIPLAILVFGQSTQSDVFLVVFGCTWPMLIQSMYGVQEVDEVARHTARSFGLSWLERVRFVIVPSALPFIATGVRLSASFALIIAVTAEIVIGSPGLGRELQMAQQGGAVELLYALILASGLLGVTIQLIFTTLESRFMYWHQSQRPATGS